MNRRAGTALMYAALSAGIVSALGILLVPSIARAFDISVASAQWMLTLNLLCGVVATPIMGRLSDGRRKRAVFVWSIAIIGAGSVVCAAAPTFEVFLLGRALQGLSYGIYPVAASIARRQLAGTPLRRTMSGLAISGAIGTGLGYPITGLLAELGSFRVAYVFGALFMATAVLVAWRVSGADPARVPAARHPFDVWGALLLGGGLAPLLYWIAEGPRLGWVSAVSLVLLGASAVLLVAWVLRSLRTAHPLVDVRSLLEPDVMLANFVATSFGLTMYVVVSGSGLVAQAPGSSGYGYGWTVALAGLVMLPLTLGTTLANQVVARLRRADGFLWALPFAALLEIASSVLLVLLPTNVFAFYGGILLAGAGMGAAYAALPLLIARSVDPTDFGSAVSFNQLLRTVGGSIGSAVSGAIVLATATDTGFPTRAGVVVNFSVPGGVAVAAAVLLLVMVVRRR